MNVCIHCLTSIMNLEDGKVINPRIQRIIFAMPKFHPFCVAFFLSRITAFIDRSKNFSLYSIKVFILKVSIIGNRISSKIVIEYFLDCSTCNPLPKSKVWVVIRNFPRLIRNTLYNPFIVTVVGFIKLFPVIIKAIYFISTLMVIEVILSYKGELIPLLTKPNTRESVNTLSDSWIFFLRRSLIWASIIIEPDKLYVICTFWRSIVDFKCKIVSSLLTIELPNGSQLIFKGMDDPWED